MEVAERGIPLSIRYLVALAPNVDAIHLFTDSTSVSRDTKRDVESCPANDACALSSEMADDRTDTMA